MNLSIADTPLREDLQDTFHGAHPFPLVGLDNMLPHDAAIQLLDEISKQQDFTRSNDYIFARKKFESPRVEKLGVAGALYAASWCRGIRRARCRECTAAQSALARTSSAAACTVAARDK